MGPVSRCFIYQKAASSGIELVTPKNVICHNTLQNMQSGIIYGAVGQIDGIVNRIKKEYGKDMTVIATGGLAGRNYRKKYHTIDKTNHFLTLTGLRILYEA